MTQSPKRDITNKPIESILFDCVLTHPASQLLFRCRSRKPYKHGEPKRTRRTWGTWSCREAQASIRLNVSCLYVLLILFSSVLPSNYTSLKNQQMITVYYTLIFRGCQVIFEELPILDQFLFEDTSKAPHSASFRTWDKALDNPHRKGSCLGRKGS